MDRTNGRITRLEGLIHRRREGLIALLCDEFIKIATPDELAGFIDALERDLREGKAAEFTPEERAGGDAFNTLVAAREDLRAMMHELIGGQNVDTNTP